MAEGSMIDRNGHRFGATISSVALLVAFVVQPAADALVPVLAAVLGVGAFFGLRYSVLGMLYRGAKRVFKLSIPVLPEEETPPRFAQLLGFVFLGLASLSLYVLDSSTLGWTFALLVAGLQALLGVTGICVGCEIYLYGRRFAAKGT